jgi:outer membrane protein OmpA-like peptidoglycan-associated protein
MKSVSFLALSSVLLIAGCSHYSKDLSSLDQDMKAPATQTAMVVSPQDIAPAAGTGMDSESFRKHLAREYYDMARFENDKAYDYKASKNFTSKAVAANKGQTPVPSKISSYDIPSDRVAELTAARKQLVEALKTQNFPENASTLARAQCRYECWLERAEEAPDESHYAACKEEFEQSMAALTMPAAGNAPTVYDIAFGSGSAIIDPASSNTVELIAVFLKNPDNAAYTANVTGFGDAAATSRVNAVRDALISKGVPAEKLNPLLSPAVSPETADKVQVALIAPPAGVDTPYVSTTTKYVPVTPTVVPADGSIPVPMPAPTPAPVQ